MKEYEKLDKCRKLIEKIQEYQENKINERIKT